MLERYIPNMSEPVRRWARLAGLLVALGLLCWLAYKLRTVFTPLLIALAIAYVLNPLVTWVDRTRHIQRLTTVSVVFVLLASLVIGGGAYVGSKTIAQIAQFGQNVERYCDAAENWVGEMRSRLRATEKVPATAPVTSPAAVATSQGTAKPDQWWRAAVPLLKEHGVAIASSSLDWAVAAFSNLANLIALLVLIPVYTFFFLWRFDDMVRVARDHLPADWRDGIVHVVRTIDGAMASFFRGRLIVCLVVGALTGLGWSLVGVPYSLPLGGLVGLLNLIPFLSLLTLPPALFFAYFGAVEAGAPWAWPVVLTMAIFMAVQALESFVLSPTIMGRSSGLHPLVIVVALLIGGQLAGLLGMLLAIPVASTLKALAAELLLPEIRRLAGRSAAGPPGPAPDAGSPADQVVQKPQPGPQDTQP